MSQCQIMSENLWKFPKITLYVTLRPLHTPNQWVDFNNIKFYLTLNLICRICKLVSCRYNNFKQSYEHANATNTSAMADAYINQNPEKGTEYKGNIKENDYR